MLELIFVFANIIENLNFNFVSSGYYYDLSVNFSYAY